MKLKQLFLAVTITLFAISCTKQDAFTPQPDSIKTQSVSTMSVGSTSTETANNKAYIFVEPLSKFQTIKPY